MELKPRKMISWRISKCILRSYGLGVNTMAAHYAWNDFIAKRPRGEIAKRPIADILIGAFASRFDGLLTRNARDFQKLFPSLRIQTPK